MGKSPRIATLSGGFRRSLAVPDVPCAAQPSGLPVPTAGQDGPAVISFGLSLYQNKAPDHQVEGFSFGTPKGNRTPVSAVRGRCPNR